MRDTSAAQILVRGLQLLLGCTERDGPNAHKLERALQYAGESQNRMRSVLERLTLLRSAAAILQAFRPIHSAGAENELLGLIRVALTAAMFELTQDECGDAEAAGSIEPLLFERADQAAQQARY